MVTRRQSFVNPNMGSALRGSPIQRDYMNDPRRLMAQQLQRQGTSTAPVSSIAEGLTRALSGGLGGYFAGQARGDMQDREQQYGEDISTALAGGQAQPWVNPDTGAQTIRSEATDQMVPTAPAGGIEGIQAALGGIDNPDLAQFEQQIGAQGMAQEQAMKMADIQRRAKLADAKELKASPTAKAGSSGETWGKTPVWGKDENGKSILGVVSDMGNFKPLETGEFSPERQGLQSKDLGDRIVWTDATGTVVKTEMKKLGPAQTPVYKAEASEASKTGGKIGEENANQFFAVKHAFKQREDIGKLITHLETTDARTGMGAEMLKNVDRLKTMMGSDIAAGKVADTEILDVMMGKEVFPMIKALGVGARGMDTPAEREFMRSVLTGSISLNKATLIKMAQIRNDVAERTITNWNERMDSGELDRFYKSQGIPKTRYELNKGPKTEAQQAAEWAKDNPTDPRAAAILQKLGAP